MTSLIDAQYALSYRFPIGHEPLNRLVSEIFRIKVADKQTYRRTHTLHGTSTDNRGRLKLAAHEPTNLTALIGV